MTSVESWGPPNRAAHTAGRVINGNEPLRAPKPPARPSRPWVAPPRPDPVQQYVKVFEQLLGSGWGVCVWEERHRLRFGIRSRHACGFAMEAHVDDDPGLDPTGLIRRLGTELLAKERRHSCEAIAARQS